MTRTLVTGQRTRISVRTGYVCAEAQSHHAGTQEEVPVAMGLPSSSCAAIVELYDVTSTHHWILQRPHDWTVVHALNPLLWLSSGNAICGFV